MEMQVELVDQHDTVGQQVSIGSVLRIQYGRAPRSICDHRYHVATAFAQHRERLDVAAVQCKPQFVVLDVEPEARHTSHARFDGGFDCGELRLSIFAAALELHQGLLTHPASQGAARSSNIETVCVSVVSRTDTSNILC